MTRKFSHRITIPPEIRFADLRLSRDAEQAGRAMTPSRLKSLRARLGWPQQRLAEYLGVTRNTINRWEMGLHPIPPMAVKLIMIKIV